MSVQPAQVVRDNDAALVAAHRKGDAMAFDALMRRYKDRVYNLVFRFLGNHEDAQDIAQEAFVRAYQKLDGFRGDAQFYTWLCHIAANLSRNRLRDRQRKGRNQGVSMEGLQDKAPGVAQAATAVLHSPREEAQKMELEEALNQCLAALPELFRMTFVLRVSEERSYDEIARSLECPRGTVKSRLNQARRRLWECLNQKEVV